MFVPYGRGHTCCLTLWAFQSLGRGQYGFCLRFVLRHMMIHIGKLIETELRRQERSVAWFARNLYCERTNVYDIFKRRSIDTELLLRISLLLQHNFFRHYMDEFETDAAPSERQYNSTHP